ncbi:MAG: DNA polymerase III subunit alpha [Actinomycetota bacterium]|nr:DNA polymerase III subunit alpha [Actinomycetota bacterium]
MGSSGRGFAHLHVRSGFSYGFGVATPGELVAAAAELGMGALALTDRNGLYGIPKFLEAAEEAGISPVIGIEVSVEGGGHLVLLADGMAGYRSLCRLLTCYRCGSEDRRKPLCPLQDLLEHADGLVCLTGAIPFGHVPRLVLAGRGEEADRTVGVLREAFGRDLYVELTDDRTAGSRRWAGRVVEFARRHGLPVLATNEVAYLEPANHRLHDVLVAAANLTNLPGPSYRPTDQLYLKPFARMQALFQDRPDALRNAAVVAERCAGAVDLAGEIHVPSARLRGGETAEGKLARLALKGAKERYGYVEGRVRARLRRELLCVAELGFAPYFLLAREAVEVARGKGVPVTGRGSAANSIVSYCLGLTQPEPFRNRLLFERFMHEFRSDAPDIDLDLCSLRRDEVRDELARRYERCGVAVAATAQTMSLRGAVRVAARALGHTPREINELSKHVPTRFRDRGRTYTPLSGWEEALAEPAMRGHPLQDTEKHKLLLELSGRLAGRYLQAGTHLGGLVFGNERRHLSELAPVEPSGMPGLLRVQYDKDDLEYAGIPKLDLLGLRMHTALHAAGELASKRVGRKVDPYNVPPDDRETYALIRTGRNAGMFQLESPGQMHLSRRLGLRRFSDLVAQISLFRPGPVLGDLVTPYVLRRHSKEEYSVPLEELEPVLRSTYGVLIFQEQVLEVAHVVAGFSLAEGDQIRRAMTRDRGLGAMRALREEFVRRAVAGGVEHATAREVFSWMEGFAAYGFSAAHAASFASLSYASAYMKRHYPAEFFCALLNSQPMGFYSPRTLLNEARREGIYVLPPDIHLSGEGFTVEEDGTALKVGLKYVRGLSRTAISSILSERETRPFASVTDLYARSAVERDSLGNLIRAGFLDRLASNSGRNGLLSAAQDLPEKRSRVRRRQAELPLPHPASWWETRERLGDRAGYLPLTAAGRELMEWEALSLNVSRHPLWPYRGALKRLGVTPSQEILDLPHGLRARGAGLLEELQRPPTRSGRTVYFLLVEDEAGLLQATIFEGVYKRYGHVLHQSGAFLLEGRVEQDYRRGFSFVVERIGDLWEVLAGATEARVPEPRRTASSSTFVRAKRRGRRVG